MDGVSAPSKSTTIAGAKRFYDAANDAFQENEQLKAQEKTAAKKAKKDEKAAKKVEENRGDSEPEPE